MKRMIKITVICLVAAVLLPSVLGFAQDLSSENIVAEARTSNPAPSNTKEVPEPSTMFLLGSSLFMVGLVSKKRTIH